jgi:hypothetical protein
MRFSKSWLQMETSCSRSHFWTSALRCRHMEIFGLGNVFFSVRQICDSPRGPSQGCTIVTEGQKWLREQGVSFYRQWLENLNKFWDYIDKYKTNVQTYRVLFLSPIISTHLKNREKLSDLPIYFQLITNLIFCNYFPMISKCVPTVKITMPINVKS